MERSDVHMLTPAQLRILANPLREEILGLLCREALSAKGLSERLEDAPLNLHYHLERLRVAGLVEVTRARRVRGATEKFFRAVASNFSVAPDALAAVSRGAGEHTLLPVLRRHAGFVLGELGPALAEAGAGPPVTSHQRLRLTAAAAGRLRNALLDWLEECRAADGADDESESTDEWLLFTAFFQRASVR